MATLKALTSTEQTKLNRSNRAAQDAYLGSRLAASGSYIATAADATASSITIQTSLPNVTAGIVQAYRSGSPMYAVKQNVSGSKLVITTSASGTWVINAADVIVYTAIP
jgi:hypothetical protein